MIQLNYFFFQKTAYIINIRNMTLTIYSNDFDSNDNVLNGGFSGDVFVESSISGERFHGSSDNLNNAIRFIIKNDIVIDEITYNYVDDGNQMFKRLIIKR